MRPIGFSTGALAYSDFRLGLSMLHGRGIHAVELSALRQHELEPLVEALDSLDLSQFTYIAFHAPSDLRPREEEQVLHLLERVARRRWPIVVHPDSIHTPSLWAQLGDSLCIENTDKRKPIGRTAEELSVVFRDFPDASFCFDIGHAKQVDSTMTEAYLMLKAFGARLRQVHVSEVNTRSKHDPLSYGSILAFREVAHLIPEHIPLILETPIPEPQIDAEIDRALSALPLCQKPLFSR
jgi:hypothetical protein